MLTVEAYGLELTIGSDDSRRRCCLMWGNHTDGGDPTISPLLFNFEGMNIFNVKAKIIPAGAHKFKYIPAVSIRGVLRTNDPLVVQFVEHKNATNGDLYRCSF